MLKESISKPVDWEQGDCFVGKEDFFYRLDPQNTIANDFKSVAKTKNNQCLAVSEVEGFMIVTQDCDIEKYNIIEISPLVKITDKGIFKLIKTRRHFNYAFIPQLENKCLVAHLGRVMTVEKPVWGEWLKTSGLSKNINISREEKRQLARVLERKRGRVPFPSDFEQLTKKLKNKIKQEDIFDLFREIRVQASPSWEEEKNITLTFFLILENENELSDADSCKHRSYFKTLVEKGGRFKEVSTQIFSLKDLTAHDYINADPLQFS